MFDTHERLTDRQATHDLAELYGIFGETGAAVPRGAVADPAACPAYARELLAHHSHMTVTLERHHGGPVSVEVAKSTRDGDRYARKIILRRPDGRVVLYGIMRFDFRHCSAEVRDRILEEKTPLGRILIEHDVLRKITTHAVLRLEPTEEILRVFGLAAPEPVYGRLATIFCNHEPAVDLLEIVPPERESKP